MSIKTFMKIIIFCLLGLTLISFSVNLFGNLKQSNEQEKIDYSQLTYVAFGDSLTASWEKVPNAYPELVANSLGLKSFVNKGVHGATLSENDAGRTNMTQTILKYKAKADIISVMLGTNDIGLSLPLGNIGDKTNSTFYGSLYLVSEHLTKNYPNSFVFYMTPFVNIYEYNGNLDFQGHSLNDFADAFRYYANKYDFALLDMYNLSEFEKVDMLSAVSDGVHPSQEFTINYTAPKITQFIKDNYKK